MWLKPSLLPQKELLVILEFEKNHRGENDVAERGSVDCPPPHFKWTIKNTKGYIHY